MKIFLTPILVSLIFITSSFGQERDDSHDIIITVEGWTEEEAYLGYYVGKKTYIADTAKVTNGRVIFEGDEDLDPGMYFLYTPNGVFVEFLVNEDSFSMRSEIGDLVGKMEVLGSTENRLFFDLQRKMAPLTTRAKSIREELEGLSGADSLRKAQELSSINEQVTALRRRERDTHSDTYYSQFLNLILRPEIDISRIYSDDYTIRQREFEKYKLNFWNGTDFENRGIYRNPVFENKLNDYLEELYGSNSASIIQGIKKIFDNPMNKEVFRYIVMTLTNKYAQTKTMGLDAVYVYMVDTFYKSGQAYWNDESTLTKMVENSNRLKPILIGKKAPLFNSVTLDGIRISNPFSGTNKDYKIVYFYDSSKSESKEAIPMLIDAYRELERQNISVDIISMNLFNDQSNWESFIKETKLGGKILGDPNGISDAEFKYFISSAFQIYILDSNDRIIAKKISVQYADDFILDHVDGL